MEEAERVQEGNDHAAQASESFFDGGFWPYLGIRIATGLVNVLTLTVGNAWTLCIKYRWEASHTLIDGRRTRFDGSPAPLFAYLLAWNLLTLLTLGIYGFKRSLTLERWRVAHTHIAEDDVHSVRKRALPIAGSLRARARLRLTDMRKISEESPDSVKS